MPRRTEQINIRLSKTELREVERLARKWGMPVSMIVRRALRAEVLRSRSEQERIQELREALEEQPDRDVAR